MKTLVFTVGLLGLLSAVGCGKSTFVVLDVRAECGGAICSVPTDVDALVVAVFEVGADEVLREINRQYFELAEVEFPMRLLIENVSVPDQRLRERIGFFKDDVMVAIAEVEHVYSPGKANEVPVVISIESAIP